MVQVGSKLRRLIDGYAHWCPGCLEMHRLPDSWTFVNGNLESPTFTPSFRHSGMQRVKVDGTWTGGWILGPDGKALEEVCHYILTDGILNFCGDCTHFMAGISVPLPVLAHCSEKVGHDADLG